MEQYKLPQMLTADVIDAIAKNANSLKALAAVKGREFPDKDDDKRCKFDDDECCCPKLLKFKCWFSYVTIINKNAECEDKKDKRCC